MIYYNLLSKRFVFKFFTSFSSRLFTFTSSVLHYLSYLSTRKKSWKRRYTNEPVESKSVVLINSVKCVDCHGQRLPHHTNKICIQSYIIIYDIIVDLKLCLYFSNPILVHYVYDKIIFYKVELKGYNGVEQKLKRF